MKHLIAFLTTLALALPVAAAELGDDWLHNAPWLRDIPEIAQFIEDNFFVVQINMFGDVEVTDFDGTTLPEKDMVKRWGALFTPNIYFFPEDVSPDLKASAAAVANMPGAFGRWTTFNMLNWVVEKGYDSDEPFQKYHARKFETQKG